MSRTTKYKIGYFLSIMILSAILLFLLHQSNGDSIVLISLIVIYLIPGRIQGLLWRDFFRGRKLMTVGRYQESIMHFERFIEQIERKKWLKNVIWLAGFIYTKDIQAMSLNNIGACYLELGRLEESKIYFESALEIDTKYAVPYFNLSIISELEGNHDLSQNQFQKSVKLGYSQSNIDLVIRKAQEIYANIEGRGAN